MPVKDKVRVIEAVLLDGVLTKLVVEQENHIVSEVDLNDPSGVIATQINEAVAALIDSSPGTLDTLNELAAALGDDANFAATVTNALAGKQDLIPNGTFAKVLASGNLVDRPAATEAGQRYLATDTNGGTTFESLNGATWTQVGAGVTGFVQTSGATGITVTATPQSGQYIVANPSINSIAVGGLANAILAGGISGSPNVISGVVNYSVIVSGYDNIIGATSIGAIFIGGGAHHRVSGPGQVTHATILAGSLSTIRADAGVTNDYSYVGAGSGHTIHATPATGSIIAAAIGAGATHVVGASYAGVWCGTTNSALALFSLVVGGNTNTASGQTAAVVCGTSNVAAGANSFIGSGANCSTGSSAVYAIVVGGLDCDAANPYSFVGGGRETKANGDYSGALYGYGSQANATYSMATGRGAVATIYGQQAHGSAFFTTAGDGQINRIPLYRTSTNATPGELRPDKASNRLLLGTDNTVWGFTVTVTGKTAGTVECARYRIEGIVKRAVGVVSLTLVQAAKWTDYEDVAGWDVAVSVDTTNGSLVVNSTGEAAKNINWMGELRYELIAA
jgi:hypothetical protein